jgi:hypothetical protein
MRLALFIFTMSLTAATVAVATPLDRINRESAVCLSKQYSPEHLRSHPLQTVKSIAVQLFEQPDQKDHTVYLNMQIEAKSGSYDAFMICDRSVQGLSCMIECDGGGADIVAVDKSEDRLQFVNKGFMMAGGCGGGQEEENVWLEPTPGGDDVFDLETADRCP